MKTLYVLAFHGQFWAGTPGAEWADSQVAARRFDLSNPTDAHEAEGLAESTGGRLFPVESAHASANPSTVQLFAALLTLWQHIEREADANPAALGHLINSAPMLEARRLTLGSDLAESVRGLPATPAAPSGLLDVLDWLQGDVDAADAQGGHVSLDLATLRARLDAVVGAIHTPAAKSAPSLSCIDLLGQALEYVEAIAVAHAASGRPAEASTARDLSHAIRNALHAAALAEGEELSAGEADAVRGLMLEALRAVLADSDKLAGSRAGLSEPASIGLVRVALAAAEAAPSTQATVTNALASLFATMPEPPDDMASLDGLTAYAEAVLDWRAHNGFPSEYDGPVGPNA